MVKQDVLSVLEENRGKSVSGEMMAKALGVSRSAIWKAIRALEKDGYGIEAVTNKGYRLTQDTDLLSVEGIRPYLAKGLGSWEIRTYGELDSTNQEAKRLALRDDVEEVECAAILAECQTKGKGRMGRSFHSPPKSGLYMSFLLHPRLRGGDAVLLTTAASVAVCRAIRRLTDKEPRIKWVNDVYLEGRKICGILTEAVSNWETGELGDVVVGIGVNLRVKREELPYELRDVVGALFHEGERAVTRNELAAEVMNQFYLIYEDLPNRDFIGDYRKWSLVLGEAIRFLEDGRWTTAKAVDVDEDGGLRVLLDDGGSRTLKTGEITLRLPQA